MFRLLAALSLVVVLIGCSDKGPQLTGTSKFVVSVGVERAEAAEERVQSAAVDPE